MRKASFIALISILLNIALSGWLVNNYFYDPFFRAWVDFAIGQYYPYIVLSIGLGGGSGLGYLLLRRRGADHSIPGRLQKSRPLRHGPTGEQGAGLLSIASSTESAKHTAYNVPPLPRPSPSPAQPNASLAWSAGAKSSTIRASPPRPSESPSGISQSPFPNQSAVPRGDTSTVGFKSPRLDQTPVPAPHPPQEVPPRFPPVSQWRPEPRQGPERAFEPTGPFPKQGVETGLRAVPPPPGQSAGFQQSKWQPPDSSVKPVQRLDNVPREGYSAPKWLPPAGQSPKSPGGSPQRPSQFAPQRAPFGPPRPPPRPIAYPGGTRPSGLGPPVGPRPIRPDQARPPSGILPRPAVQRPSTVIAPGPHPPLAPLPEKKPTVTDTPDKPESGDVAASQQPIPPASQLKNDTGPAPAGELDWDTALDTILKTLRKDKVETK